MKMSAVIGITLSYIIGVGLLFAPVPKWFAVLWLMGSSANLGYAVGESKPR